MKLIKSSLQLSVMVFIGSLLPHCTHKVQIEPSDKPFVVNLNVKVDHEIRHKIEKQNEDLLSLESEAGSSAPKKKAPAKKGGKG